MKQVLDLLNFKITRFQLISFLIIENSIVAVLLGDKKYSLISHAVLVLFLLIYFFIAPKRKQDFHLFIFLASVLLAGLFFHFLAYRDYSLLYLFTTPQSLLIGYVFFLYFKKLPVKLIFYFNFVLFCLYILVFTSDGNAEHFLRTTYVTLLCHFWFLISVKDYIETKKLSILPTVLFLFLSIISYSRIGIGVSGLVLIIHLIQLLKKNAILFVLVPSLITLSLLFFFVLFDLTDIPAFQRFAERGLDSGRYEFWSWYLSTIDLKSFLVGNDQNFVWKQLSIILDNPDAHYTLHNSFLQFHSFIGVFGVIILLIYFTSAFKWFLVNKNVVLLIIFLGYMGIAFFSTIMLPQRYDYVFFCTLFLFATRVPLLNYKNER